MELTPEQKRALAIARARKRKAEAEGKPLGAAPEAPASPPEPSQPQNTDGFGPNVPQWVKDSAAGPVLGAIGQFTDDYINPVVDEVTQGLTFGFGDNLTAAESALLGRKPGGETMDLGNYDKPLDEAYSDALAAEQEQQAEFADANPVTATVAELAGAVTTAGGLARRGVTLMKDGKSLAELALRGAGEGAAYGGLYALGESDGDLDEAAWGAGTGAATGAVLSPVVGALTRAGAQASARKATPEVDDLKRAAGAAYDRARAVNPALEGFDELTMQSYRILPQEGYHPNLHPKVKVALDRVEELSAAGTAPRVTELEQLRRLWANAAGSADADERRIGRMFRGALDNFMETAAKRSVDPRAAPALADLAEGRSLWRQAKKGQLIQKALYDAELNAASAGSGGNINNAVRQQLKAILKNDRKRRGFNDEEIAAMEHVVRGGPVENLMRLVGKMSPSGNGLMLAMQAGPSAVATAATGNPAFMALAGGSMAVGGAAKSFADRATRAGIRNVDILSRGGAIPQSLAVPESRRAIINALAGYLGGVSTGSSP